MEVIKKTVDARVTAKESRRAARERFAYAHRLEKDFMRHLRSVIQQVDAMVRMSAPEGVVDDLPSLQMMLRKYSDTIRPWAQAVSTKMLERIARKDETSWNALGKTMGRALRKEIQSAPTGELLKAYMDEQVKLITSLPLDAAERVHKLTIEGLSDGTRAKEIAREIMKTGKVLESRAKLIARTEVARTASGLTMARSLHIGVTHYVWRTSKDADVRKSHRQMEGQVIPWDTPPVLSDGTVSHAGMIYNCRCYADPIITD